MPGIRYGAPFPLDALGEKVQHIEVNQELSAFGQLLCFLQGAKHEGIVPDVQHALEHDPGIVDSPGELDEELEHRFHHCPGALAHHGNQPLQLLALGKNRRRFPKSRKLGTRLPNPRRTAHGYFKLRSNLGNQHRHPVFRMWA